MLQVARGATTFLRNSARARAVLGASAWSSGGYAATTALRFTSRLVLAKLLHDASPMGDVALVVVILAGLEMLSDLGVGHNIIQHRRADDPTYLGTVYTVQLLRGLCIWVIASALAWPIAAVYKDPDLIGLLLVGSLSSLFFSAANPGIWLLRRAGDLRAPTLLSFTSELAGFLVTVAWALVSPSAWAIVLGTVATAAAYAVGSHFVGPRTFFAWDRKLGREVVRFGGWMMLSSGTYFLASRGESLILRGQVPEVQFGVFSFAVMLVAPPVVAVTQVASHVFFPMLAAQLREDRSRALRAFTRGKWAFTALSLAFVFGGMFLGPPIVSLLGLESTFHGLGWMVQVLGIRAGLEIMQAPTANLLFAFGSSRYAAWANVIRLAILVGGLYLTVGHWGLPGAIWILVAAPAVSYAAFFLGARRYHPAGTALEMSSQAIFWAAAVLAIVLGFRP